MKKKKFDCVEMMHEGATAVKKKISGFTREQELGFWRTRTQTLREERKRTSGGKKLSL
jgi:hypothetical protein